MLILSIRSDKPQAEIGLFEDNKRLVYKKWQAHRRLAETLHSKIVKTLSVKGLTFENLGGIVVFRGPGSFTGLRIGISTANALAAGLSVPIIGAQGRNWRTAGIKKLLVGHSDHAVLPDYDQPD